jgi:hypothetical protein
LPRWPSGGFRGWRSEGAKRLDRRQFLAAVIGACTVGLKATMIYTHVLIRGGRSVQSPADDTEVPIPNRVCRISCSTPLDGSPIGDWLPPIQCRSPRGPSPLSGLESTTPTCDRVRKSGPRGRTGVLPGHPAGRPVSVRLTDNRPVRLTSQLACCSFSRSYRTISICSEAAVRHAPTSTFRLLSGLLPATASVPSTQKRVVRNQDHCCAPCRDRLVCDATTNERRSIIRALQQR